MTRDRGTHTEDVHADYEQFDAWSLEERLGALIVSNQRALDAVADARSALVHAATGLRERLLRGGRLVYIGAGTSGRLALQDAAELPPTFGFSKTVVLLAGGEAASEQAQEGAEDDEDAARGAVRRAEVSGDDAVIGVAASGGTPYTVAGVQEARSRGAFTVGVANNPGTRLLEVAESPVLLATGPEVVAGSTRLAAGTAQKVALNALSTAVMPELGGVYKNLMVGMKPVNDKLYKRAVQMVQTATGQPRERVEEVLRKTDWSISEAILRLETDLSPRASRGLLTRYPRLRDALKKAQG